MQASGDGPGRRGPSTPTDEPAGPAPGARRHSLRRRTVRTALTVLTLGLFAWYLIDQADAVGPALGRLSPVSLLGALVAVVLALVANMLSWRAVLRGLGSPLPMVPAARLYFVAQLGKYLPGSIWPVLAQVELARDHGVPRARSAAAALLALLLGLAAGVAVAAVTLLAAGVDVPVGYVWALAVVPVAALALSPSFLRGVTDLLMRLLRRPPLDSQVRASDLRAALGWSVTMWLLFGAHIWLLAAGLHAADLRLLLLATGAYSAAWVAGFVVVFLPAGAGAREAVLWVVLGTSLAHGDAVAIALASRALTMVGDGLTAGSAAVVSWRRPASAPPPPAH